jgi:hypothetical protein
MTEPARPPHMSNWAIEDAATAYVLNWEAAHGRPCHDTRSSGSAADVASAHRVTR